MTASMNFSLAAQALAQVLNNRLQEIVGEPVAFVLVVQVEHVAQYVANVQRKDGVDLIESLLARWKAGRADIPAHYNPDLKALPEQHYREQADALVAAAAKDGVVLTIEQRPLKPLAMGNYETLVSVRRAR